MRDPVIITGTPRSGIWLVAGAFDAAGGFGGLIDAAGERENTAIRDRLEQPFLEGLGCEPRGLGQLPHSEKILALVPEMREQWRSLVNDIFTKQDYHDHAERFIASQVSCLLWPLWHAAFPQAKWIVVRRTDVKIIAACQSTGFLKPHRRPSDTCHRFLTEKELVRLIEGYKLRFEEMQKAKLDVTEFWPKDIYEGKQGTLQAILESNGLSWSPVVAEFVRPYRWAHGNLKTEGVDHVAHN